MAAVIELIDGVVVKVWQRSFQIQGQEPCVTYIPGLDDEQFRHVMMACIASYKHGRNDGAIAVTKSIANIVNDPIGTLEDAQTETRSDA